MSSYQYHFPPLTIFKDKNEDKEIVGLNYEYLDEICSFIESFLTEKDLTYKLIGVEYGYNLTELKFLDKSSYEYREEVIEKAGYHATTALYKALEEQLNKHFCTKSQIKINSVATTRGDESSFIVHLPHKYIREVAFRQILQKCKDEKYFTGCFSIRQNGTPYVLTGKQSQFITLSAENDSCIKNTIHCMISGLISLLSPADLSDRKSVV